MEYVSLLRLYLSRSHIFNFICYYSFHDPKDVKAALMKSLKNLKTDYLDLYLIHWPMGYQESGENLFPKDEKDQLLFSDVDYVDTWRAFEEAVDDGLVKSIGLSNFNSK